MPSKSMKKTGAGATFARVDELAQAVLQHKRAYYAGKPLISDAAYDALEEELRGASPHHPVLEVVGSGDLGEDAAAVNTRVEHDVPMLSLNKTYDLEELRRWQGERVVMGTLKVDGNSLSLIYRKGRLELAKTRGNGRVGEDVTAKVRWVSEALPQLKKPLDVEIRGELYCVESKFLHLSDEMVGLGLERPTNPRNIVAGLLGRKSHFELARYFGFFAFEVVGPLSLGLKTESEKFDWLGELGFSLPMPERLASTTETERYLERVRVMLEEDELGLDGAVFSYDDLHVHDELGVTAHHPRYKISFKWPGQTATTSVRHIAWATSRLGIVTPVAVVEPVYLSGAQITNVTLHNAAHVRSYNLKSGDKIEIIRSGEVIPKFLSVVESVSGEYQWPKKCGDCHELLVADDVRLKCPNTTGCPAQKLGTILNWIRAAEIDDLSEKRLLPLLEQDLVKAAGDLYRLKEHDFLVIPSTKEKMAAKLYKNIQQSRNLSLPRFLNGLGIEGAGLTTWEKLIEHFASLKGISAATVEQIQSIEGFAEKSARQIVDGLLARRDMIADLLSAGVKPTEPVLHTHDGKDGDGPLAGRQIVITGALSKPRNEVEELIKAAGGKLGSAVSKNTYAVVTEDPSGASSKLKKARELGVQLWSEADLLRAIE